jgi:hypothetical protein
VQADSFFTDFGRRPSKVAADASHADTSGRASIRAVALKEQSNCGYSFQIDHDPCSFTDDEGIDAKEMNEHQTEEPLEDNEVFNLASDVSTR